ncbi:MAG: TonB family protein [Bacteroidales bacterium]|nr:TonB family protein [Bacteroidales bacterium]
MRKLTTIILAILLTVFSAYAQRSEGTAMANLNGRSLVGNLPRLTTSAVVEGTVVLTIKVDQYGNVTEAIAGAEGTSITNNSVWNAARSAALRAHFDIKADAPALQTGTITFTFGSGTSVRPSIDYDLTSLKELVENKQYGEFIIRALFYDDYRDLVFLVEEDDYIIPIRLLKKDLGAEKRYRDLNIQRGDTLIIKGVLTEIYVNREEFKGLTEATIIEAFRCERDDSLLEEPKEYSIDFASIKKDQNTEPFQLVEEKPSFNGGDANEFSKWVNSHLKYPKEADCAQGRVTVQFTVDIDGSVKNVSVLRGVEPSLDAEAVRVVSRSPKWKPGKSKGKPVPVRYTFPVIFQPR